MPTASTTFYIDTTAEYDAWTVDTVVNVTVSHNTADTDADATGSNGQMNAVLTTKNNNRTGHFRIQKTWEDLGVPVGSTVTHCQVVYSEKQYLNAQSSNSDTGPFQVRSSDNTTLTVELLAALNRTTTSSYANRDSGTVVLPSSEASNTSHWLRLTHRLQTPNTTGAQIGLQHDWIRFTVTYITGGVFAQNAFGFYKDGNETTSEIIGSQDTNIFQNIPANINLQLRLRIQETNGQAGATTDDWQVQYSKNGGAYTNITTSSSNVKGFDSTYLTDENATTQRLTNGSGSFVAGEISEDGLVDDHQITASNFTEYLYSLTLIKSDLSDGNTLDFRVLLNGGAITYNITPRTTVGVPISVALNNYLFFDVGDGMSTTEKIR